MDKRQLTETEIRTRYITPAILNNGWEIEDVREEHYFTDGRIIDEGKGLWHRGTRKRADYLLTYKSSYIAVIEAKDNNKPLGSGMQQAIEYASILDIPFAFSSNGDGFIKKNRITGEEVEVSLDEFPNPEDLWSEYIKSENITEEQEKIIAEPLYPAKYMPRYYQQIAIERTTKAIAKGKDRILLVMATGTGKTYTAFQIIYRLWKSKTKRRILYLADRNILIDQTMVNDFAPFEKVMTKIKRKYDPAYEVYLGLYQQLKGSEGREDLYKKFPADFFDLIVIDECHRGSAAEDSAWREILTYFKSATQVGMTATPKNKDNVQNFEYFGDPLYTYSLRQGIEDGFLAPYRVIRVGLDKDIEGLFVKEGTTDYLGHEVESGEYNAKDFDKTIVLPQRTKLVAKIISDYLKNTNRRFDKSIFFCVDIEHAERMRKELINENLDLVEKDERYVMRITGDDEIGKNQLDNFINPRKKYPTLVTTSKLLTTGIDAKTCKLIVLDTNINSMIEFKQIIGRGTRIAEDFNKATFTIIDFRNVTKLFQDPEFDGDPIEVKEEGTVTKDKAKQPKIEVNPEDIMEPKKKEKRYKFYLPNESVYEIYRHERLIDEKGNLITESFMQYVKNKITKEFETHTLFTQYWNSSEIKETVIKAMEEKDIYFNILEEMVGEEYDPFDLIMHVAYDKPALTRSQRARKVKQSEYFEKYGEQAKEVIKLLLTKYVDKGIRELENPEILNVPEFKGFGSMLEIINNVFKGIKNYKDMINHLKKELYQ